ncbi:MAG: Lpg1974 family pore-forming outer membrane protein [Parachlamydiales bacterium]
MFVKSLYLCLLLMTTSLMSAQYYKTTDRSIAVMGKPCENGSLDEEIAWEEENAYLAAPAGETFLHEPAFTEEFLDRYRFPIDKPSFYANADFLYWKAYCENLDYVTKGAQPPIPSGRNQGPIGTYLRGDYEWAPGFRLGMGYCFKPDFWEIEGDYTFFFDEGNNSAKAKTINPPSLNGAYPQHTGTLLKAKSHVDLHYHVADLYLASRFLVRSRLLLRFQFGPTGAFLEQKWKIIYTGFSEQSTMKVKWRFEGLGFRLGMLGDWIIGKGFGIFSQASLAGIFGVYHNHTFQRDVLFSGPTNLLVDAKIHEHRLVPHFQFLMGPSWGKNFRSWSLFLSAGYELNLWMSDLQEVLQGALQTINNAGKDLRRTYGTFGTRGYTFKAQVNF